jgi:hypothetical protein
MRDRGRRHHVDETLAFEREIASGSSRQASGEGSDPIRVAPVVMT